MNDQVRPRLRDLGAAIFVTAAAGRTYASAVGCGIEEARRELTELLLDARQMAAPSALRPGSYRYRSQSLHVDISASVSIEGPLAVVVAVSARSYRQR